MFVTKNILNLAALQDLIKEARYLFKQSRVILLQLALMVLSSYGGGLFSTLVVLGIFIWNLSKNRFQDALILFLVLLLFSDSNFPLFKNPGKAKDYVALMLAYYIFTKTRSPMSHSFIQRFWPYLGVAFVGLILADFELSKRFLGFQKLASYGLLMIIVPAGVNHVFKNKGALLFLRKLVFVFAALYVFSILMSRINPGTFAYLGRLNGIHRNPNGIGIFSALFIMNLWLIKDKFPHFLSRKLFLSIVGVFLAAIVLSASRNSMLSLGVFFLFRTVKIKFFVGLVLVIFIASGYGALTYIIEQFIVTLGLQEQLRLDTLSYASGRIYVWEACWYEIQDRYWIGHGFTYEEWSKWDQKHYERIPMLIHNYGNIHNSYLTIWLNTGLLGLLSFLLGLIALVVQAQKRSPSIAPMFFAALLIGFFESYLVASLNPYTWQIWFGFTLAILNPSILKKRIKKRKKSLIKM